MNINNVYDEVTLFFSEELDYLPLIINQDLVEGFLRQKAWQGKKDADLREIWGNLKLFLSYLTYSVNLEMEEMSSSEYSLAVEWLSIQMDFSPTLNATRRFFEVLGDFYNYLYTKKLISEISLNELNKAKEMMTSGKQLKFIEPEYQFNSLEQIGETNLAHIHQINPENVSKIIGEAVERLMLKFSSYFQQDEFIEDFDRALMLYVGPAGESPEETDAKDGMDEFWLGFWDYFLFDYHLLENDFTPLEKFNRAYSSKVSTEEKKILNDLMEAKFTVFYVSQIINQDWVECVNLFTQETFRLPNPNFDYKLIKKLLFFGHVFFQQEGREFVMINFITSVEVSAKLRKRIKEEVERQKAIFDIQEPQATWPDYLRRHANILRHTIDLLASGHKVNVTPHTYTEQEFPVINKERGLFVQPAFNKVYSEVEELIDSYMPKFTYSRHDVLLAKKIWLDYCFLTGDALAKICNPSAWAAAVIYVYSHINADIDFLAIDVLGEEMAVKKSSVNKNKAKLIKFLQIQKFDPRYLSEEGFLYLLYQ